MTLQLLRRRPPGRHRLSTPTASTSPSRDGVTSRVRRGAFTGGLAQALQQMLSVAATLVLARLLTPEDFGLVAAATSILALSGVVLAVGVAATVIRKRPASTEWLSSLHWSVVLAGAAVSVALALAAAPLSALFGLPEAAQYVVVLAPTVVLGLAASVPLALLRRRLMFGRYWLVQVLGMTAYVAVQIVLAIDGWGVWSVVIGQLVMAGVKCGGAHIAAGWVPSLVLRPSLLREDVVFATGMLGNRILGYGHKNADYWVVGGILGAAALGGYYIAFVLPSILRLRAANVVGGVLVPTFARTQDDVEFTKRVYVNSVRLQSAVGFPAMVGLAVLANPIVDLFFGARWSDSAGPLRWIALACMVELVATTPNYVSIAHGRTLSMLTARLLRLAVFVPAAAVAAVVWQSTAAVAMTALGSTVVWAVLQQALVARPLGLHLGAVAPDLARVALITGVMAFAVHAAEGWLVGFPSIVEVAVAVPLGAVVYCVAFAVLFRRTFRRIVQQLRSTTGHRTRA